MTDTSRISVSAHYTGYIWYKHGLSAKNFITDTGRRINMIAAPINAFLRLVGGADIDIFLLQRHTVIDHKVEELIEKEGVTQIVELACGLSPRGYRFRKKYPHIRYVECDLPGIVAKKRELLDGTDLPGQELRVCDVFNTAGPESIKGILESLDPQLKTIIVTEGLVNYFELPVIREVWSRMADALKRFPQGWYITELYPDFADHPSYRYVKFAQKTVGFLTKGDWPLHYPSDEAIQKGFQEDGFDDVEVIDPASYYGKLPLLPEVKIKTLVRIIKCSVSR